MGNVPSNPFLMPQMPFDMGAMMRMMGMAPPMGTGPTPQAPMPQGLKRNESNVTE